ncbi:MAG: peptidylprolyl isomerase [Kaiparowitsia implicata GSE-PSE-MK54-09C]|jgi:parvulin-like peptidyl-prolyl isomerase|nr:peptidylprolyl isomerase [Kaiparowitsia implicata GSE-PSE-MK54-09C]
MTVTPPPTAVSSASAAISVNDVLLRLSEYQLLPQFLRESIIDRAIAPITCTPEETNAAVDQFFGDRHLSTEADRQIWLEQAGITLEHAQAIATRPYRIEKFKETVLGIKLESYFLQRSRQLDKALYSLIRIKDMGIAQELYFRIESGEQSFANLAQQFSLGPEANSHGIAGPVELGALHPVLGNLLRASQPGELHYPIPLGEWVAIVRLEQFIPVQFDAAVRRRLLEELFDTWLRDQLQYLPVNQQAWLAQAA